MGSQTHINGCRQGLGCEIELGPKKDATEEHEDADTGKNALQSNLRGRLVSKEMRKNVVPFEISCRIFRQLPIELYGLGLEGEDRKVI